LSQGREEMNRRQPRIAVIGCGVIVETAHLPALTQLGMTPALLVDTNLARARQLAEPYHVPQIAADWRSHRGRFDAAIVATPPALHASVCAELLAQGVHVLVEKPMATSSAACRSMLAAAEQDGATLAVGLMRRFLHVNRWAKSVLEAGLLGEICAFDVREGTVFHWPAASAAFFDRKRAGGGVLMDIGVHTLDILLWLLGEVTCVEYRDDSYGGVEADCLLRLKLTCGAQGVVELSRTRDLRNTLILEGTRGRLEIHLHTNTVLAAPDHVRKHRWGKRAVDRLPPQRFEQLFVAELADWLQALQTGRAPEVTGREGMRPVELIERCYAARRELELPWMRFARQADPVRSAEARGC